MVREDPVCLGQKKKESSPNIGPQLICSGPLGDERFVLSCHQSFIIFDYILSETFTTFISSFAGVNFAEHL